MNEVSRAWKRAGEELRINITAPFTLKLEDGRSIKFLALISDFGLSKGTLILDMDDRKEFSTAEKHGYYCSALNPEVYGKYNRKEFIDTLEDWRFIGKEQDKPDWYTGKYYK
jgi:hypothetical protein